MSEALDVWGLISLYAESATGMLAAGFSTVFALHLFCGFCEYVVWFVKQGGRAMAGE